MRQPVVVTGGTGTLGRAVVTRMIEAGHEVRVVSRRPAPTADRPGRQWATADLLTGAGVPAAVAGGPVIVHCATSNSAGKDITAAEALIKAAAGSGCRHLVYVSIVGVDRVPLPYYRGKLAVEKLVESSPVPHTVLRATQFHDLLRRMFARLATLPVMPVPDIAFQPVDVADVAARLAGLAEGDPVGRAADLGGPEVRRATDLARIYLTATARRRVALPVRLPGRTFAAYRDGGHLAPEHPDGRITFAQYLAARPRR